MRYRKKPVEVEAFQYHDVGSLMNGPEWARQAYAFNNIVTGRDGNATIVTIHGDLTIARPGDWIVREPKPGRFYPVKPDVFAASYDPVAAERPATFTPTPGEAFQPRGYAGKIEPGTLTTDGTTVYHWVWANECRGWPPGSSGWCISGAAWGVGERIATAADIAPTAIPIEDVPPALRVEVERLRAPSRAAAKPAEAGAWWADIEDKMLRARQGEGSSRLWATVVNVGRHTMIVQWPNGEQETWAMKKMPDAVEIQLLDGTIVAPPRADA